VFAARALEKKGPSFGRKAEAQAALRIGSTRSMKLHAVRSHFHLTPQLASPQQRLITGALYSWLF